MGYLLAGITAMVGAAALVALLVVQTRRLKRTRRALHRWRVDVRTAALSIRSGATADRERRATAAAMPRRVRLERH